MKFRIDFFDDVFSLIEHRIYLFSQTKQEAAAKAKQLALNLGYSYFEIMEVK